MMAASSAAAAALGVLLLVWIVLGSERKEDKKNMYVKERYLPGELAIRPTDEGEDGYLVYEVHSWYTVKFWGAYHECVDWIGVRTDWMMSAQGTGNNSK